MDAVALVEARRQVPLDLRPGLAQDEDGECSRADAVRVVVAVDADSLPSRDRGPDPLDRNGHVAKEERVVQRLLAGQEGPRLVGVVVSAPDEHAGRDLADAKLPGKGARLPVRARTDRPAALLHRPITVRRASDGDRVRDPSAKRTGGRGLEKPGGFPSANRSAALVNSSCDGP